MPIYRIFHGRYPGASSYGCIRTKATIGELRIEWAIFNNRTTDAKYRAHNTATFVKWLNDQGIEAESIDVDHVVDLDIGP